MDTNESVKHPLNNPSCIQIFSFLAINEKESDSHLFEPFYNHPYNVTYTFHLKAIKIIIIVIGTIIIH